MIESPLSTDVILWIIIGVAGMVGGLLYGMRDKKFVLPHLDRRSDHIYIPGFVADLLFGLVGGFVIFIVVPGEFSIDEGGFVVVKVLALAAIGGYGGRALIETVIEKQIQDLKIQIEEMQDQTSLDARARDLLNQQLDDDPDTIVAEKELKDAIMAASSNFMVDAFETAREFRRDAFVKGKRDALGRVIPIFDALIEADKKEHKQEQYHRNHAQIAYAYKDRTHPVPPDQDYQAALDHLATAIEIRDRRKIPGFKLYEFNRAMCRIKLQGNFDDIKADLEVAIRDPKTMEWIRNPDKERAHELIDWLQDHKTQLKQWIADHAIKLPR